MNNRYLVIADTEMDFQGTVDVTDPFYSRDVWCRINDIKLAPGKYVCIAEKSEYDDYYYDRKKNGKKKKVTFRENRIFKSAIINSALCPELVSLGRGVFDHSFPKPEEVGPVVKTIGSAGVDTARLGYFHDKPDEYNVSVQDVCVCDCGFVTTTGFGDGTYKVIGVTDSDNSDCWQAIFVDFSDMVWDY